jgi:hypothetical protein
VDSMATPIKESASRLRPDRIRARLTGAIISERFGQCNGCDCKVC